MIATLKGVLVVALLAANCHADAAEIVLERSGVEKLVAQALFKDHGQLVLARGGCRSYLDQPSVSLDDGRIQIRARLAARVGFVVNGDCAGIDVNGWARLSGRPVGSGGNLRLEDLRVEDVSDPNLRALLANPSVAALLPHAVELDVRNALQGALQRSVERMQATIETFTFDDVRIENEQLTMRFEFRLVGR